MRSKLLFLLGIVAAHGALGAALIHDQSPEPRLPSMTCAYIPEAMPHFDSQRELLAAHVVAPEVEVSLP